LEDKDYLSGQLAPYQATQAKAEAIDVESQKAGENGDEYVLTTLLLATALFFAGVTTSFKVQLARLVLLFMAGMAIAYAAAKIAGLPVV
jgi:hypothetical protein